jgi:HTH-type transcriptional regulator/antitoxin HigA
MNLSDITGHWVALHEALGLGTPVRDEVHYAQLLELAERLMEDTAALESGPLGGLVSLLAEKIREYEARVHAWPDTSTPATRLAFLMEQHGLRQSDLPEIGAQSVVSAVLSGKRALNLRQTQALARRFGVPMEALVAQ